MIGKLTDGEYFFYKGTEFVRLGEEQGGVLAITAKIWKNAKIDCYPPVLWEDSELRRELNNNETELVDYTDVLTMEDACYDYVSLLSYEQWKRYKHLIPQYSDWIWLRSPGYGSSNGFCFVSSNNCVGLSYASYSYGIAPIVLFKKETVCEESLYVQPSAANMSGICSIIPIR